MATTNSIAPKAPQKSQVTEYIANGETIRLSPSTIKSYLVSGNGNVTDQEAMMFLSLCRFQHLNPFMREAYLIKYGNSPATMIVGKDVYLKRANRNERYLGKQAGIIVLDTNTGEVTEREGTFHMPDEEIVGGWAKVYIKDKQPEYNAVSFDEYAGRKADGSLNSQWASKPGTMIRKVALVQALREAFPEEFAGLYDQAEMTDVSDVKLDETAVKQPETPKQEAPVQAKPQAEPQHMSAEDALFG
jgi:phage recombination protein Bet